MKYFNIESKLTICEDTFISPFDGALVVLDDEQQHQLLPPGSYVVFYHRKADKGKVYLSGAVEISGNFIEGDDYFTLPFTSSEEKREESLIRKPAERLLF